MGRDAGQWREAAEFLVAAAAADSRCGLVTIPAPVAPLAALWSEDGEGAVLWASPSGRALAGVGEALVVAARGGERFERIGRAAAELGPWGTIAHPAAEPAVPALVGGFSFAEGALGADWEAFGEARFVLPRWSYEHRADGRATLTLALGPHSERRRDHLAGEVAALLTRLERPRPAPRRPRVRTTSMGYESWRSLVEAALAELGSGRLRKVVLARCFEVVAGAPLPVGALLAQQQREREGTHWFAFRVGGRTFLGASPELLVARRGQQVESEALAGSTTDPSPAALVLDPKQREEHAIVVQAIERTLAPLCETLSLPAYPEVRRHERVAHLCTPIAGRLAVPVPVAELAQRLHPTPAVGGEPTAAACAWIARHEPEPRGWYAGAVGVLEPGGDGVLAVALRGALVLGNRARVWAGAGIVAGSTPAGEYEETEVKARSTLAALGLGE